MKFVVILMTGLLFNYLTSYEYIAVYASVWERGSVSAVALDLEVPPEILECLGLQTVNSLGSQFILIRSEESL